jgi:ABC-type oligopeptide transport system ATPase subunit
MVEMTPLIRARRLTQIYVQRQPLSNRRFTVKALDAVDLSIQDGSSLGLVGESGSGKSTLGLCLALLQRPTAGEIWFDGEEVSRLHGRDLRRMRQHIQFIFQDTASALNPRLRAEEIVVEPMRIQSRASKATRRDRALSLMSEVGLSPDWLKRRPHEFSGGQRQRLAIARALALQPRIVILDEAFAGLDLSVQAQIVALLRSLQAARGLTYLFITHDLNLATVVCDTIAILHRGSIVEQGSPSNLFGRPQHPQTRALVDAVPGRNRVLREGPA